MERIESLKLAFTKSYNYEPKKLFKLLRNMSQNEIEIIFQEERVFKRLLTLALNDKDVLHMIFKTVPASIQDKMWENEKVQLFLMGINNWEGLLQNAYVSQKKFDRLREFVKEIKSSRINANLAENVYFQALILFSKDFDSYPSILKNVDIEKLVSCTSRSPIYDKASIKQKKNWVKALNGLEEKICLPENFRSIFAPANNSRETQFNYETLYYFLEYKANLLKYRHKKIKIDKDILEVLNNYEVSVLYNLAILDPLLADFDINEKIDEIVNKAIEENKIFSFDYLNFLSINKPFEFYVFLKVNEKIKTDKNLEEQYLKYVYDYLFREQLSQEYKQQIDVYLKNGLVGCTKEELHKLFQSPTCMKSLFHMRFGVTSVHMNYLDCFDKDLIMKLNVKQVNKIAKLLMNEQTDEISDTYTKAIKMYLVFGLDRAISILNGTYGTVNKGFLDSLSKVRVNKVPFKLVGKKYEPIPDKQFLDFIFAGDNIYNFFKKDSVFETKWFYLYNNFDNIKESCRGHISIKQLGEVLNNQRFDYQVNPDLYKLKSVLDEVSLGNKARFSDEEVYEEAINIYEKQIDRKESSIPYVVGFTQQGYKYEVMRMDDTIIYTLGYKEKCCFRVLDIGHKHLVYAALCKNGRILLTYTPDGKLASFSPIKRNGEVLIANSIEVNSEDANENVTEAFMLGIKAIMAKTKNNEDDYIKVACIGINKANLHPDGFDWPEEIETPTILEKNDATFGDTDSYHRKLKIIAMENGTKLDSLKYGEVKINYEDPRPKINVVELKTDVTSEELELINVIKAIKYKNAKINGKSYYGNVNLFNIKYGFYNDDWFILIGKNDKLYSESIEGSGEALKEMKATLAVIDEKVQKNNLDEYILSFRKKDEI